MKPPCGTSMATGTGAPGGGIYSGGGAGWVRRRQQEPSRHPQQPTPQSSWQKQRPPLSMLEGGGSIVSALARLQQSPPPGSVSTRVEPQHVLFERRDASHDIGGSRTGSRPFGQSDRGGGGVRETAGRNPQRSLEGGTEAVRVAVRVRPMSEREEAAGLQRVVSVDDDEESMSVVDPTAFAAALALERDGREQVESSMWAKCFSFDRCFRGEDDGGDGQEKVFEEVGAAVINQAFSGYNSTVFAYGQTGSGKSYTMMGTGKALDDTVDPEDHGLIPRICSGILERIDQMECKESARLSHQGSVRGGSQGHGLEGSEEHRGGFSGAGGERGEAGEGGGGGGGGGGSSSRNTEGGSESFSRGGSEPNCSNTSLEDESFPAARLLSLATAAARGGDAIGDSGRLATNTQFSVEVSYLEIYNESLRDLFNPATSFVADGTGGGLREQSSAGANGGFIGSGSGLRLREDPRSGTYVEGLTSIAVSSWEEMSQLLTYGGSERTVAATNANDWSSRSHAVFTLTFRQKTSEELSPTGCSYESWEACSNVNLVDLAGSERVSHTGATGLRLQEAGSINRSLAALSDVIKALSEAQRRCRPGWSARGRSLTRPRSPGKGRGRGAAGEAGRGFVPYRNSVLTRLLKESLGGNSRTVMLACISPCDAHYEETLGTLRYAERAKRVRTRAIANAHRGVSREGVGGEQAMLVERLTAQVLDLKQQLAEANATKICASPASTQPPLQPPMMAMDIDAAAVLQTPGTTGQQSPAGFPHDRVATGGQGYIYVVDPSLQGEIERLKETVAERDRIIKSTEKLDRTKRKNRKESSILPDRGRNSGQRPAVTGIGRSSNRPRPGDSVDPCLDCSSDCSPSSTSPRLSITTPPRAGLHRSMERPSCNDVHPKEGAGEGGSWRSGMRLLNLNQDLLFSECISFPIRKEGAPTVVGSGEEADVRLDGDDVLPHHATIILRTDGAAVLSPTPGARVHINGVLISADEEVAWSDKGQEGEREMGTPGDRPGQCGGELRRDYRVVFGSRHYFRVDCPFQHPSTVGDSLNHEGVAETMPTRIDWEFAQEEIRANNNSTFRRRPSSLVAASNVLGIARPANTTGTAAGVGVDVDEKMQVESKQVLPGGRQDSQLLGNGGVSLRGPVADTTGDSPVAMDKRSVSQALPNQETPRGDEREPSVDKVWANEPSEILAPGDMVLSDGNALPSPGTPPVSLSPLERPDAGDSSREIQLTSEVPTVSTVPPSPSLAETDAAGGPPANTTAATSTNDISNLDILSEEGSPNRQPDVSPSSIVPDAESSMMPLPSCDFLPVTEATVAAPKEGEEQENQLSEGGEGKGHRCGSLHGGKTAESPPLSFADYDGLPRGRVSSTSSSPASTEPVGQNTKNSPEQGIDEDRLKKECPPNANEGSIGPRGVSSIDEQVPDRTNRKAERQRLLPSASEVPDASSRAAVINKATLIELKRAREAWRGAEGELERSQQERDELRAILQAVQEQASERRRADRKEKRELDKEKAKAEYRARDLEADRDRLRRMLSKSDEQVADLRGQLQKAQATTNTTATTTTTTTEVAAFVDGIPVMTAANKPDTTDSLSKPPTTPPLAITPPTTGALPLTPTFSPAAEIEAGLTTASATSFGSCLGSEGKRRTSGATDEARHSDASSDSRGPCQAQPSGTVAINSSNVEFRQRSGEIERNIIAENGQKIPMAATSRTKGSALRRPKQPQSFMQEVQQQQERVPRQQKLQPLPKPLPPTLTSPSADDHTEHKPRRPSRTQDIGRSIDVVLDRPGGYRNDPTTPDKDLHGKDTMIATGGENYSGCPLFPMSRDDLSLAGKPAEGDREGSDYLGDVLEGQERAKPEGAVQFRLKREVDDGWMGKGPAGEEERTAAKVTSRPHQSTDPSNGGDDGAILGESRADAEADNHLLSRCSLNSSVVDTGLSGRRNKRGPFTVAPKRSGTVELAGSATPTGEATRANSQATATRSCLVDRAGDFYRTALSTHLSFIATTAADDPDSVKTSTQAVGDLQDPGRSGTVGVGEACKTFQGDMAGVRQRLEALQSKFSRGESGSAQLG